MEQRNIMPTWVRRAGVVATVLLVLVIGLVPADTSLYAQGATVDVGIEPVIPPVVRNNINFTLDIVANTPDGTELAAHEGTLNYDQAVLDYVSLVYDSDLCMNGRVCPPDSIDGTALPQLGPIATAGEVAYGIYSVQNGSSTQGATGKVRVAHVTLKPKQTGTTTVTLAEVINVDPQAQTLASNVSAKTIEIKDVLSTAGVFRPSDGGLFLKYQNFTGFADSLLTYGLPGDKPIAGDWDGDGIDTIGVFRDGTFFLRNLNTSGFADIVFTFGLSTDQPVAGDWNGDGVDTVGLYRDGLFMLRNENSTGDPDVMFALGNPDDIGIAGDWNGDGVDTTGVFRPSDGGLFLKNQNTTGFADLLLTYGLPGDKPVTGDWDGDGVDSIGVYRNGTFMLRNSNTNGFADLVFTLGIPSDEPIAGDWGTTIPTNP